TNRLIDEIRNTVPDIALRTTLICGYPGETLEEHEELLEWVKEIRFDRLGVFTYSHEEKTHAFKLNDDVEQEEKLRRQNNVMKVQQEISLELNQRKVGKNLKVLIDKKEDNYYLGRSEFDSPDVDNEVLIKADDKTYLRQGEFYNVKIIEASEFDLQGEII
ncbi:MAG: 30S ribosomal protein S12 methylthiotransferase RimO, partial [Bacteroidota bacterium]